jgi:hypothetical protein
VATRLKILRHTMQVNTYWGEASRVGAASESDECGGTSVEGKHSLLRGYICKRRVRLLLSFNTARLEPPE